MLSKYDYVLLISFSGSVPHLASGLREGSLGLALAVKVSLTEKLRREKERGGGGEEKVTAVVTNDVETFLLCILCAFIIHLSSLL